MNGLSLLATTISVLSFPLVFLSLLYPQIASPKRGRWPGFFFYLGVSVTALLVAVLTATGPNVREEDWKTMDWLVFLIGGGGILAFLTRKWWWPFSEDKESLGFQQVQRTPRRIPLKQKGKRRKGS